MDHEPLAIGTRDCRPLVPLSEQRHWIAAGEAIGGVLLTLVRGLGALSDVAHSRPLARGGRIELASHDRRPGRSPRAAASDCATKGAPT